MSQLHVSSNAMALLAQGAGRSRERLRQLVMHVLFVYRANVLSFVILTLTFLAASRDIKTVMQLLIFQELFLVPADHEDEYLIGDGGTG